MNIKVIRLLAKNLAIPGNIGLTGLEHLCHWGRFDVLSLAEPWGWWSPWAMALTACSSLLQPQPVCAMSSLLLWVLETIHAPCWSCPLSFCGDAPQGWEVAVVFRT